MSREKKAESLLAEIANFFKPNSVNLEEQKPTEVKFESELPVGEYELMDGTKFTIDEEGNVVGVIPVEEAPEATEEELAEAKAKADKEEEAKLAEETKLSEQAKELEDLKAKVIELSAAKPLGTAPQKRAEKVLLQITPNMTFAEKVNINLLNNK